MKKKEHVENKFKLLFVTATTNKRVTEKRLGVHRAVLYDSITA